jgi:hypothetical protein
MKVVDTMLKTKQPAIASALLNARATLTISSIDDVGDKVEIVLFNDNSGAVFLHTQGKVVAVPLYEVMVDRYREEDQEVSVH